MNFDRGSQATLPNESEVLSIGGGPAGSSAAIILADRGYDVVLRAGERRIPIQPAQLDRMTTG